MQLSDLPEVLAIEQQTQFSAWTKQLFEEALSHYACWVMENSQTIIGFGILLVKQQIHEGHIMDIAIKPTFQGHGFGRALMRYLIDCAKVAKIHILFLEVRRSNVKAIMLYQTLGFNELGVRQQYYPAKDGREDALVFALDLTLIDEPSC